MELVHPAHTQYRSRKSPTKVPSTSKQISTDRDEEIEDLRDKIKLLKQNQKKNMIRKSNLSILRIRKTSRAKKHPGGLRFKRPY